MKRLGMLLAASVVGFMATAAYAGDACDINGDGTCNAADEAAIMDAQGTQEGDAGFIAAADLDGDGVISLNDVSLYLDASGN